MSNFNAQSCNQWKYDISNNEGVQIKFAISTHGPEQLIYEPFHILSNLLSSTDFIFANHWKLLVDSGTYLSFHLNCHYQIIIGKINLQLGYHLLIKGKFRIMLKLISIQIMCITMLIKLFISKWICLIISYEMFSKNFVPNKLFTCVDRDPPWINGNIKSRIKVKYYGQKLWDKW